MLDEIINRHFTNLPVPDRSPSQNIGDFSAPIFPLPERKFIIRPRLKFGKGTHFHPRKIELLTCLITNNPGEVLLFSQCREFKIFADDINSIYDR